MSTLIKKRHLSSGSTGVVLPVGSNAQRPDNPIDGMIRYNTSNGGFVEFFNSTSSTWVDVVSNNASAYGNSNVAAYLPVYSGNISAGNISASGNITGANLIATGNIYIGNTVFTRTLTVGRAVTSVTVPLASNNSFNVLTAAGNNVKVYTT